MVSDFGGTRRHICEAGKGVEELNKNNDVVILSFLGNQLG